MQEDHNREGLLSVNDVDSNEYFNQKRALLKECVSLSEELLGNIGDLDAVNNALEKRSEKIRQIQALDDVCRKDLADSWSQAQQTQIDEIVSLLLGLDRDAIKTIKEEQTVLKNSMKVNTKGHKLANYTVGYASTSGRLLDKKK